MNKIGVFCIGLSCSYCDALMLSFFVSACLVPLCFCHLLSLPLHPIATADPLEVEFALELSCDSEFCSIPEAIHLTGEVLGELG